MAKPTSSKVLSEEKTALKTVWKILKAITEIIKLHYESTTTIAKS